MKNSYVYTLLLSLVLLTFACQQPPPPVNTQLPTFIQGRYAYVPARMGVQVVDINTPQRPQVVGTLSTAGQIVRTQVQGDYLYALKLEGWESATGIHITSGVVIASLEEPTRPQEIAFLPSTYGAYELLATDSYLFVADWAETRVYDIQDPATAGLTTILPIKIDQLTAVGESVYGAWSQCYFRSGGCKGGVYKIDVTQGEPTITHNYEYDQFGVYQLLPYEHYLYLIGNGFAAVPADQLPQGKDYLQLPSDIYGNFVAVYEGFFLTASAHQLRTIKLDDPAHPHFTHQIDIAPEGTFFLDASQDGRSLYLVSDYGLHVLNISDPENPYGIGYVALG